MISTAKMDQHRILVLRSYVPLEQILFSKMTLFGSVYHHQKVKCLDAMLRSMIQHINENANQCMYQVRGAKVCFSEPVEYLYATDDEFFSTDEFGDGYIKTMLDRFRRRDLFVRCLEISRRTVTNWKDGRLQLVDLADMPMKLDDVEKKIYRALPSVTKSRCNIGDVRLSIPNRPKIKGDFAFIQTSSYAEIENIEEFFPLDQWTDAYAHNKWRSYVYAPRDVAEQVRNAAVEVLHTEIGLRIDLKKSNQTCHLA